MLKSICVFCGSSFGTRPVYAEAARTLGQILAQNEIELIYGGATSGLMGVIADATLEAGGRVTGVIPQVLVDKEFAHTNLTRLYVVYSMHDRKAKMADMAEAFIAMPGGFGTLEEFFEILTWAQLGMHRKPCALLNVAGYYDPMRAMFDHMITEGLVGAVQRDAVLVESDPLALVTRLQSYAPPVVEKWLTDKDQR